MDEQTPQPDYRFEPWRFLAWLPVYLIVAFALYVLSAGPMYWLIYEAFFLSDGSMIALLYLPLGWLSSNSDIVSRWLDWYIGLWIF